MENLIISPLEDKDISRSKKAKLRSCFQNRRFTRWTVHTVRMGSLRSNGQNDCESTLTMGFRYNFLQ